MKCESHITSVYVCSTAKKQPADDHGAPTQQKEEKSTENQTKTKTKETHNHKPKTH